MIIFSYQDLLCNFRSLNQIYNIIFIKILFHLSLISYLFWKSCAKFCSRSRKVKSNGHFWHQKIWCGCKERYLRVTRKDYGWWYWRRRQTTIEASIFIYVPYKAPSHMHNKMQPILSNHTVDNKKPINLGRHCVDGNK